MTPSKSAILFATVLVLGSSATLKAQAVDPEDWRATRVQLEAEASRLERAAASRAYGERTRAQALERLNTIRRRLASGDFSMGERILVQVRAAEVNLSDTLTVLDSLIIAIPNIRRIGLGGVLRSELEGLVTREVAEVVRGATVRATSLMRVLVLGEVVRPGYINVPPEVLLDQLITFAGGPTPAADLAKARIVRGDTVLVEGDEIRRAVATGRSLALLNVQNGDAVVLPTRPAPWDRASTLQIVMLFVGPLITLALVR